MEKKEWSEPELTVLVRSKPEEMVLANCKTNTHTGASDNMAWFYKCDVYDFCSTPCTVPTSS